MWQTMEKVEMIDNDGRKDIPTVNKKMTPRKTEMEKLSNVVGSQAKIARALNISESYASRVAKGHRSSPPYIKAIRELIEIIPHKDWPNRWK